MPEKRIAHSSAAPVFAPALAAAVTVPGPMNAAAIADHRRIEPIRFIARPCGASWHAPQSGVAATRLAQRLRGAIGAVGG